MARASIKIGMKPMHPGAFIRQEIFEELDLPITKAADILGVRRATLSELVNCKGHLTPDIALRIEAAFNVKADTLMNMQTWHDLDSLRRGGEIKVKPYTPEPAKARAAKSR